MADWGKEIRTFLATIMRHLVWLVTSSIFAASGFFYEHTSKPIHVEIVWSAAILFFFISCFLAWRDEYRQVLTRQRKRTLREGLADLHERGVGLLLECEDLNNGVSDQDIYGHYANWDRDSQTYLQGNLDRSYVTRFNNPVGLSLVYADLWNPTRTRVWRFVANRTARLQQFMDDYKDS
jgi:hypothetical protein